MTRLIELPLYKIRVFLHTIKDINGNEDTQGTIESDLHISGAGEEMREYEASVNTLESLILAQACAGIDITTPSYIKSIETVIDAWTNCLEECM